MSKPPRIDRKSLKGPDEFVKKGQVVIGFLAKQQNRFIPIVILALLVLLGVYGYDWWTSRNHTKAWVTYQEGMRVPEKERPEKMKEVYQATKYSRPSLFAAVYIADFYFDEAKKEILKTPGTNSTYAASAVEWYGKALEHKDLLASEKQLLLVNRGGALEMQKKFDEALTAYREASEITGEARGLAMLNLGRALEMKADNAKAIETYEKIAADFNNTEYSRVAKNYLRRLKSPNFLTPKS